MVNPIRMGRENIGPCQFVKVILGNQDRHVRVVNVQKVIEIVEPIISGCQSLGAFAHNAGDALRFPRRKEIEFDFDHFAISLEA